MDAHLQLKKNNYFNFAEGRKRKRETEELVSVLRRADVRQARERTRRMPRR
jgi:hypothetical protein